MRRSKQSHRLAVLRLAIGLEQKEMAERLGCSVHTVQSIELGRLALSEGMTQKVWRATGVSPDWLRGGDATEPIINEYRKPYTKADYEAAQAHLERVNTLAGVDADFWVQMDFARHIGHVAAILLRGIERNSFDSYTIRLRDALAKVYFDPGEGRPPSSWDWIMDSPVKRRPFEYLDAHGQKARSEALRPAWCDDKHTRTRPELSRILDLWEARFKELLAAKRKPAKEKRARPGRRGAPR